MPKYIIIIIIIIIGNHDPRNPCLVKTRIPNHISPNQERDKEEPEKRDMENDNEEIMDDPILWYKFGNMALTGPVRAMLPNLLANGLRIHV